MPFFSGDKLTIDWSLEGEGASRMADF